MLTISPRSWKMSRSTFGIFKCFCINRYLLFHHEGNLREQGRLGLFLAVTLIAACAIVHAMSTACHWDFVATIVWMFRSRKILIQIQIPGDSQKCPTFCFFIEGA